MDVASQSKRAAFTHAPCGSDKNRTYHQLGLVPGLPKSRPQTNLSMHSWQTDHSLRWRRSPEFLFDAIHRAVWRILGDVAEYKSQRRPQGRHYQGSTKSKGEHYMTRAFFVPISFWRSTLSLGFFSMRVVGGSLDCQFSVLIPNILFAEDKERGSWCMEEGWLPWHTYSRRSMSQLSVCPEETKRTKWSPHCLVLQIHDQLSFCWRDDEERVSTCDVNLDDIRIYIYFKLLKRGNWTEKSLSNFNGPPETANRNRNASLKLVCERTLLCNWEMSNHRPLSLSAKS